MDTINHITTLRNHTTVKHQSLSKLPASSVGKKENSVWIAGIPRLPEVIHSRLTDGTTAVKIIKDLLNNLEGEEKYDKDPSGTNFIGDSALLDSHCISDDDAS